MPADILIYAVVAAGLVFWLRNVLGTRHGDERQRPNPFSHPEKTAQRVDPKILKLNAGGEENEGPNGPVMVLGRNMGVEGETAEQGLVDIARVDHNFDLLAFMEGAQDAFVILIEAFAEGDRETLRNLLDQPVYEAFDSALKGREDRAEKSSVEIHAIRRAAVVDAQIQDKIARITVRFIADETSVLRDAEDKIILGHPDRVTETIDIWTFSRDIRSRHPAWLVCETREDEADTVKGSTVPETKKG